MKRLALHALLALALILQGVPSAFGAMVLATAKSASTSSSMPCCPDGMPMQADGDGQAPCPDCPDCSCGADCLAVCPACVIAPALPATFGLAPIPNSSAPPIAHNDARDTRSDNPPTRPPIA